MADPLDRFTRRARQALTLAQEEAQRLNHSYIGTEHLLIGLIRVHNSVASKVLHGIGIDLKKVRELVEQAAGTTRLTDIQDEKLTPRIKRVLELAVSEARSMGHHYIDTAHVLLGLIHADVLLYSLFFLPAVVGGALGGVFLHHRVSDKWFTLAIYSLLTVVGAHMVITSIGKLFGG